MKLAIVIPAYNEETVIHDVISKLPKKLDGIDEIVPIVVDDGSTDNTYKKAKSQCRYVFRHVVNLGVGAATSTGFEAAKKLKADIVVTLDGDGQHNPNDVQKLIEPILSKKADVVIGTRMLDYQGMPVLKIVGNWLMNFLTFLVFRKWSSDTQSGMKAFNSKALKKMCFHAIGYEICSETIGEIKRNKLKYAEVPIEVLYTEYSKKTGQIWVNGINIFTKIISIKMTKK
jgi:glycosyltransferase involved in cell wall biosynthesis